MLAGVNRSQDVEGKRRSALTVQVEFYSSGEIKYKGYHATFQAGDGDSGWMIDYYQYTGGIESRRETYDDAAATWNGRDGYF